MQYLHGHHFCTSSSAPPLWLPPKKDPPIMSSLITHCCKCCWQIPSVSVIFLSSTFFWVTYGFTFAREKSRTVSDIFNGSRYALQFFIFGMRCMNKSSAVSTHATQDRYLWIWIYYIKIFVCAFTLIWTSLHTIYFNNNLSQCILMNIHR